MITDKEALKRIKDRKPVYVIGYFEAPMGVAINKYTEGTIISAEIKYCQGSVIGIVYPVVKMIKCMVEGQIVMLSGKRLENVFFDEDRCSLECDVLNYPYVVKAKYEKAEEE